MALPSSTSLPETLRSVISLAQSMKQQAERAVQQFDSSTSTSFLYAMIDRINAMIVSFNLYAAVTGINAYATSAIPGYEGTLTGDISAVNAAGKACVDWIVANYPKDAGGFVMSETLNVDGTRTPRSFTPLQVAPLKTLVQAFVASFG